MDNKLQNNGWQRTSEIQALIRREIISLAALYDKSVNPAIYDIWFSTLQADPKSRNLSMPEIQVVFAKIRATFKPTSACPFPATAHFFEFLEEVGDSVHSLVAEEAWNAALDWTTKWYLGEDLGFDRRAPRMEEKQLRGIRAAGGFPLISTCSTEELQWAKKRFIENFAHSQTVEADGHLTSGTEDRKILDKLRGPTPLPSNRALPASPREHNQGGVFAPDGKPDKSIYIPLTQEQEDSRRQLLRDQARQIEEKYKSKGV